MKTKVLIGLVVATIGLAMLAPGGRAQTPGSITVLAVCNTDPETTAILNNTDTPLTIFTLGSIKDPQLFEPIPVNQELAPGASVTFYLGPTSPAPALSPQRIYDNTASDEGALVVTSAGTLTALCGSGAGSLAGLGSNVAATATPVPETPSLRPTTPSTVITPPDTGDGGLH